MYEKVDTSLNFTEKEKEVIKFWKENNIFEEICASLLKIKQRCDIITSYAKV